MILIGNMANVFAVKFEALYVSKTCKRGGNSDK